MRPLMWISKTEALLYFACHDRRHKGDRRCTALYLKPTHRNMRSADVMTPFQGDLPWDLP